MAKPDLSALGNMPHLAPSVEEAQRETEKSSEPVDVTKPADDPKLKEKYPFVLDWKDPNGKRWTGAFTNKILNIQELRQVAIMRARLNGQLPAGVIDGLTDDLNLMLAHMALSLVERPEWAKNLDALLDTRVVYAIYTEVASHEATFLGWEKAPEAGPAAGGEG